MPTVNFVGNQSYELPAKPMTSFQLLEEALLQLPAEQFIDQWWPKDKMTIHMIVHGGSVFVIIFVDPAMNLVGRITSPYSLPTCTELPPI